MFSLIHKMTVNYLAKLGKSAVIYNDRHFEKVK